MKGIVFVLGALVVVFLIGMMIGKPIIVDITESSRNAIHKEYKRDVERLEKQLDKAEVICDRRLNKVHKKNDAAIEKYLTIISDAQNNYTDSILGGLEDLNVSVEMGLHDLNTAIADMNCS